MSSLNWRRVGKGSGPGNVLNDRYEIIGSGKQWVIKDLDADKLVGYPCYHSMKIARREAERIAGNAAPERCSVCTHGEDSNGPNADECQCGCSYFRGHA